jgi:alpha-tubulin suppressor-like RCC1 family protein
VCWGELVDSAGEPYVTVIPTHVPELHALGISAGAGHTCALAENYSAVCWGNNDSGQLGDGTFQASATPVAVLQLAAGVGQVAAGGGELEGRLVGHSCAIDKSSQVACWGRGAEGQLGSGIGADAANSQVVLLARVFDNSDQPTLGSIVRVDLGALHSCALASQGALYCWGDDTFEQLGSNLGSRDGGSDDSRTSVPGRAVRVARFGSTR